jgi:hypothetical protein
MQSSIYIIANASIPIAVGAVVGAAGSLIFVMRTSAIDKLEQAGNKNLRKKAVARVLMSYTAIAWLCLIAAVAIGDVAFIALTGTSAVLTTGGVLVLRRWPQLMSPPLEDDLVEPSPKIKAD